MEFSLERLGIFNEVDDEPLTVCGRLKDLVRARDMHLFLKLSRTSCIGQHALRGPVLGTPVMFSLSLQFRCSYRRRCCVCVVVDLRPTTLIFVPRLLTEVCWARSPVVILRLPLRPCSSVFDTCPRGKGCTRLVEPLCSTLSVVLAVPCDLLTSIFVQIETALRLALPRLTLGTTCVGDETAGSPQCFC